MKKTFYQVVGDDEIALDSHQDFTDEKGIRHPRNILWLWNEDDLWDICKIKVVWSPEPSEILELDPIQIPTEPELPAPVVPPDEPLPPAPPAPPAPLAPPPLRNTSPGKPYILEKIKEAGIEIDEEMEAVAERLGHTDTDVPASMVAYGGIAFRTLHLNKKGDYHQGHRHNYDHVTNLIRGSVICEVDSFKPRKYVAPCQITIGADHWHKFIALEDDVIYQCVYRQPEREDLYTTENDPYGQAPYTADELITKLKTMDNPCAHCDCDKTESD